MSNFTIAIHGGAGTISPAHMTPEKEAAYRSGLANALELGHQVLREGGTAMEAVTVSVCCLEDYPLFNAGAGSVFSHEGRHEMDASLMDGKTNEAGAVTGVTGIRNPILLAREVMLHSGHVMLAGNGAEAFAVSRGFTLEEASYFYTQDRWEQWQQLKNSDVYQLDHVVDKKFGTVGAVALDLHGNLAAATSTGGMTNKKYGRVGDTPIIGAGTWADNQTCAISCTGHGEFFIRSVVAYDVACLMAYQNMSLQQATEEVVQRKLLVKGGEGGLIGVDAAGNVALTFNSEGMYRASRKNNEEPYIGIYR